MLDKYFRIGLILYFVSNFFIDIYLSSQLYDLQLNLPQTVRLISLGHLAIFITYSLSYYLLFGKTGKPFFLVVFIIALLCLYYNIQLDAHHISLRICDTLLYFCKFYFAYLIFKSITWEFFLGKTLWIWIVTTEGFYFLEVLCAKTLFYLDYFNVIVLAKQTDTINVSIMQRFFGDWYHWMPTILNTFILLYIIQKTYREYLRLYRVKDEPVDPDGIVLHLKLYHTTYNFLIGILFNRSYHFAVSVQGVAYRARKSGFWHFEIVQAPITMKYYVSVNLPYEGWLLKDIEALMGEKYLFYKPSLYCYSMFSRIIKKHYGKTPYQLMQEKVV